MLQKIPIILTGKAARHISRLKGGGSALPGLIIEKIDKKFLNNILSQLPLGVVVVSGTNGKTTTTKMVVELLRSQDLKVFTNPTGSNFKRGVISSILGEATMTGKLAADIAVLELDEAHAVHFVRDITPTYSLLLNVMRDQLDRFGEIDKTAEMLEKIALRTTKGVVLNREDARVERIAEKLTSQDVRFFGLSEALLAHFPSDDDLYGKNHPKKLPKKADVVLEAFKGNLATFRINSQKVQIPLALSGVYNIFNAAAAITLVKLIMGKKYNQEALLNSLQNVESAFGRGEKLTVNGKDLELVLVKNPSGFRLGLSSFNPDNTATMIAINDNYADGRDMSWLWDIDFSSLKSGGVRSVSGVRAYDMALRLDYDDVPVNTIEPHLEKALKKFITNNTEHNKRIYCTYTAMLTIRKLLKNYTNVERVL